VVPKFATKIKNKNKNKNKINWCQACELILLALPWWARKYCVLDSL
jgi:hypothetical protein